MKIRKGFVSNSSSSSFLIYGVAIDQEDLEELLINKNEVDHEKDDDDMYYGLDDLHGIFRKVGLEFIYPADFDCYYVGASWDSIKDDETGAQFKKRVKEEIKKVLDVKDSEFETHQEAWFDG